MTENARTTNLDHSSDDRFTDYYAEASQSPEARERAEGIKAALLRVLEKNGHDPANESLDVLDVGCNAGTLCSAWARAGHRAHGLDINGPLLDVARERACAEGLAIDFRLGSAIELPWPEASMDVCVALELLEHVEDWQGCVNEMMRVLKPGGALCITTTNVLCPKQNEFNLPLYSWYPAPLKRRYVRLAMTTRPELANYARYPAFHWFSYFGLRRYAGPKGFRCYDRFDITNMGGAGLVKRGVLGLIRAIPPVRVLAYLTVTGTVFFAVKQSS
jgi:2-polyprenyl-6-hydroxyphenyl methylase/3-demethylubiquinone-9 3-methyltransferase